MTGVDRDRLRELCMSTAHHYVDVHYEDDDERAYAECRECCWGCSGSATKVEDRADQHTENPLYWPGSAPVVTP